MNKLAYSVLIICLIIGVIYAYPTTPSFAKEMHMGDMLTQAFDASSAEAEGYSVHNWSVVNQQFVEMNELVKMAKKMNEALQIPNPQEYKNSELQQRIYQLHGKWDDSADVTLILNSMNLEGQQPQTTLVVKVERRSKNVRDITDTINRVRETVREVGATPQISTCIKGFLNDRIKITDRDQLIKRVFSSVKAKEVEALRSDQLTSVSGFSAVTKERIWTNGKPMNLQVVVQWDNYQKRTRVLVGAPIITLEY
jgi:hypothetical protein